MKSDLFPRASKSFISANPHIVKPWKSSVSLHRRKMNQTESEFALQLESKKRNGEIVRYEFEGITLRWADMQYTPDFVVFNETFVSGYPRGVTLIEVKGGHIWSRDIVRFKGARAYWPEFQFEIWQKKNRQWRRLR